LKFTGSLPASVAAIFTSAPAFDGGSSNPIAFSSRQLFASARARNTALMSALA